MIFRYLSFIPLCLIAANSGVNYGDFDLAIRDYTVCNGAKRRSCANQTVTILDSTRLRYDIVVKENLTIVSAKITGTQNHKELLRLRIKNVCDNVFSKPVIQTWFSSQDHCGIYMGHYIFSADNQALARTFFGGKFIYGNWTFNIMLYTDYCNVLCGVIQIELSPRKITDKNKV